MHDNNRDDTQSFIIRIWHEAVNGRGHISGWRGSIVHVGTGKRVYFHDLNSVKRFIQDQTGMRSGLLISGLKSWLAGIRHQ